MRHCVLSFGLTLGLVLAACSSSALGPDRAELANLSKWNAVPKSTPSAFVQTFDQVCVKTAPSLADLDASLRQANYVPADKSAASGTVLYLVDDRRPAIAVSDTMCLAQALSRTGQAERVREYVAQNFPNAQQMNPKSFKTEIEHAWSVDTPFPGILATQRRINIDATTGYALIYFRPGLS